MIEWFMTDLFEGLMFGLFLGMFANLAAGAGANIIAGTDNPHSPTASSLYLWSLIVSWVGGLLAVALTLVWFVLGVISVSGILELPRAVAPYLTSILGVLGVALFWATTNIALLHLFWSRWNFLKGNHQISLRTFLVA